MGMWPIVRQYARVLIDLRLIVRSKTVLHGRTKNLGEGGMGATVAGDLELYEVVELRFQVPESADPLLIYAEVRYRQGFKYGFKFINPTREQLEIIRETIRYLPVDPDAQPSQEYP
jgi:PilZ domain